MAHPLAPIVAELREALGPDYRVQGSYSIGHSGEYYGVGVHYQYAPGQSILVCGFSSTDYSTMREGGVERIELLAREWLAVGRSFAPWTEREASDWHDRRDARAGRLTP